MIDYSKYPKQDILCIDCKSFFASVECAERGLDPFTTELAVISRGESNGGLVLASTPVMKEKYGIKTGSRVFEFPLNHQFILVPPRMGLYLERNQQINVIYQKYAAKEDIHVYSIDETFIDVGKSHALFGSNYQIARQIQSDVFKTYGVVTCVGIGDNMLLAKLALDNSAKKKAPFIAYWGYKRIEQTIWQIQELTDFWSIGRKTKEKLNLFGIYTVKQLAHADVNLLKRQFGVLGEELWYHANGIDSAVISERYVAKNKNMSVSQILPRDYHNHREVEIVIREMVDQLSTRLRNYALMAEVITLGIGYSRDSLERGFRKQQKIYPSDSRKTLTDLFVKIFYENVSSEPIRSVVVSATKLKQKQALQLDLFTPPEKVISQEKLDKVIDRTRRKFGYESLIKASSLESGATGIERSRLLGGHRK
ncbi:Y-family DNA polymerase [Aerococcaceae bacterium NML190938]|nr:Y-family DNA polymerase [Aerococcaceae bacterium NML190938]